MGIRIFLGWEWLTAALEKLTTQRSLWLGSTAGGAVTAFVDGALAKSTGAHPDVTAWYAAFLRAAVLPHPALFANLVVVGELSVGLALVLGLFTGLAAFVGGLLNLVFLFAGTTSVNPQMFVLATWLVLAWRVAGRWGLDRWVLPWVGVFGRRPPGSGVHKLLQASHGKPARHLSRLV
jgi:thiosulfate dehydrogenase [quinone] large subunit